MSLLRCAMAPRCSFCRMPRDASMPLRYATLRHVCFFMPFIYADVYVDFTPEECHTYAAAALIFTNINEPGISIIIIYERRILEHWRSHGEYRYARRATPHTALRDAAMLRCCRCYAMSLMRQSLCAICLLMLFCPRLVFFFMPAASAATRFFRLRLRASQLLMPITICRLFATPL